MSPVALLLTESCKRADKVAGSSSIFSSNSCNAWRVSSCRALSVASRSELRSRQARRGAAVLGSDALALVQAARTRGLQHKDNQGFMNQLGPRGPGRATVT